MEEATAIQLLVENRSRIKSFALFHRSLRDLGMKAMQFIDGKLSGDPKRQFVAATIVSCREIDLEDLRCIYDADQKLQDLTQKDDAVKVHDYYLFLNRVVILLNLPSPNIHGEARLIDQDYKLHGRENQLEYVAKNKRRKRISFLEKLRKKFYNTYDKSDKYFICIFSFFIPCTIPGFMCAKLICEFASEKNEQIIISYVDVHNLTNPKLAWKCMRNCNNVYCMHPKDLAQASPDRNIFSDTTEDIINLWLDDHEYFPDGQRVIRRHKKRHSKILLHRQERKKPRRWTRDEFCRATEFYTDSNLEFVHLTYGTYLFDLNVR